MYKTNKEFSKSGSITTFCYMLIYYFRFYNKILNIHRLTQKSVSFWSLDIYIFRKYCLDYTREIFRIIFIEYYEFINPKV